MNFRKFRVGGRAIVHLAGGEGHTTHCGSTIVDPPVSMCIYVLLFGNDGVISGGCDGIGSGDHGNGSGGEISSGDGVVGWVGGLMGGWVDAGQSSSHRVGI